MKSLFVSFKAVLIIALITASLNLYANGQSDKAKAGNSGPEKLVVYSYDTFASEWGAGPSIIAEFEQKYGVEVELHAPGDGVTVMSQLILEKDNPRADVVVGLDNNLLAKALEEKILESYKSPELEKVKSDLLFDSSYNLLPFDFGYFAICYDSEKLSDLPESLEDLTEEKYRDSLVLMDPRTSTPGLGFLLWTIAVYGEDYLAYWDRLKPSILTITEGWSSGYGLFLNEEAPLVLSYSTSPAYHVEYEDSTRYRALKFNDGNYEHIEGMGIVKGTENREMAEKFIDHMLAESSQKTLAISNIMFPAVNGTDLPDSFDYSFHSDTPLLLDSETISENYDDWVQMWVENYGN
ncbi:thiamine ABC transporter substrate-binding protein [Spirochaeta isovalerica]|uniref:Thiamine transport system substrate-binding protein n=1 Tax=Spirochaeta isovalerica TaxID=150 RepID=A0A841R8C5_9SPIO|nr:thiamine ABC transporter substrate binding subunit [Spirochaeta isovalerica]MBB6478988.1 thiamine transport system substrate-binding protein [Spirochaeta isovalerica]